MCSASPARKSWPSSEARAKADSKSGSAAAGSPLERSFRPSLEVDPDLCNLARARERLGFLEQPLTSVEVAPQAFHTCKLRQNLRAARVRRLTVELFAQTAFASVEVVEVPERPKAIHHASIGT